MTVAELIAVLQQLPQHMPVKVLLGTVVVNDGEVLDLCEHDALPIYYVRQSGGYVLITGDA